VIHGMVKQPLVFTLEQLSRYPLVSRMSFVECSGNSAPLFSNEPVQASCQALHGLVSNAGMDRRSAVGPAGRGRRRPQREWVIAEGADAHNLDRQCADEEGHGRRAGRDLSERRALMPATAIRCACCCPAIRAT